MIEKIKCITREQLICLAAAGVLALLSCFVSGEDAFLISGHTIRRGEPGTAAKQYELNVISEDGDHLPVSIKVSPRMLSDEEAVQKVDALIEELSLHILGDNSDLGHIYSDLELKKTIRGYEGVRLSWYPEDTALISYDGKVDNVNLTEETETVIRVSIKAGDCRKDFALPVTVCPAQIVTKEERREKLLRVLSEIDAKDAENDIVVLPNNLDGMELIYAVPGKTLWIKILLMGIAACVLLGLRPEQERRKKLKERETELMLDYSDIISKLVIYMGAGMTVRNAWIRIADNYTEAVESGLNTPRIAYEEMNRTASELKKGISEGRALTDFAGRCSLNCYLKLISLLEQNRKTGDPRSENALLFEAQESFEQRKNVARRMGEEAGTKLMLPLVISLITVMIIVAVPAMLTLA